LRFWNFAAGQTDEEVELRISGEIVSDDDSWIYEWFGIAHAAPNAFRKALAEHTGKNIIVWIDSWGGDVFAGVGFYNALKEHKGKVTVKIDGKAVSAASIIAMAGDEILISPGGIIMCHNPWSRTTGEAKDMRHSADVLDEVKEAILNIYQQRTGKGRDELSELMNRETWMSARTAVAEGWADGVLYTESNEAPQNSFSLSGIAIQNSVDTAMQKFFELYQKHHSPKPAPEESPANSRVFDIKRRVSVREKQFRR
jgi:ATP-dependent Clp protease protease subunit